MLGRLRSVGYVALVSSGMLGCGQASESKEPAHRNASAIIGGSHDTADESVVLLILQDDIQNPTKQAHCTGSIVSPHVVLTAAHCLSGLTNSIGDETHVAIFLGDDINTAEGDDPSSYVFEKEHDFDPAFDPAVTAGNGHDIGYVVTSKALAPKPISLNRGAPPEIGDVLQIVGYGRQDPANVDSWGARQTKDAPIAGFAGEGFYFEDSGLCVGDSGGPSLLVRDGQTLVAGVHSYGEHTSSCTGKEYDARIFAEQLAYIDARIDANDPGFLKSETPIVDAGSVSNDSGPDSEPPPAADAAGAADPGARSNEESGGCSLALPAGENALPSLLVFGVALAGLSMRSRGSSKR